MFSWWLIKVYQCSCTLRWNSHSQAWFIFFSLDKFLISNFLNSSSNLSVTTLQMPQGDMKCQVCSNDVAKLLSKVMRQSKDFQNGNIYFSNSSSLWTVLPFRLHWWHAGSSGCPMAYSCANRAKPIPTTKLFLKVPSAYFNFNTYPKFSCWNMWNRSWKNL